MHRLYRRGELEVAGVEHAVLDHRQHQRARAHLQKVGYLCEVCVAGYDVESSIRVRVGVRFVAGVDNRSTHRSLEAYLFLEEVGALSELEATPLGADLLTSDLP